jgi:hypothetical protein
MSEEGRRIVGLNAPFALYGLAGPNLVRVTADFENDFLTMQYVVLEGASEEEIEDYRCVTTEVLAQFSTARCDDQIVTVGSAREGKAIPELPVRIYCRNLEASYDV